MYLWFYHLATRFSFRSDHKKKPVDYTTGLRWLFSSCSLFLIKILNLLQSL